MPKDLSDIHELISDFVTLPRDRREWDALRLTDEQIHFFEEKGYLAGIRLLNDSQIGILRAELAEISSPQHPAHDFFYEFHSNESEMPGSVLFHALGAWRLAPGFHDLLWLPGFTIAASQLLDGAVRFWHDQVFAKPPFEGGVVAWHQDYSYWTRTVPLAHLTCWIGLDDATVENGCLQYIPGSHKWPDLPITGLAGEMRAIETVLNEEQRQMFKPVAIELRAGEAAFHHPRMIHGSYENRSSQPRRATVINVFRDGVSSNSDEPLLTGVPVIERGRKIEGQFFPLLFDPRSLDDARNQT